LLKHLAILLEQDKIKIPNDEGLIAELEAFRYEMGENGNLKVRVPDNMTDDRVMSLGLAVYGQSEKTLKHEIIIDDYKEEYIYPQIGL